jgi:hypothetical protein
LAIVAQESVESGLPPARLSGRTKTRGAIMATDQHTLTDWVHLVQAEYLEMPGLQLTKPQVRRLWALEDDTCDVLLEELIATHFLRRTPRDAYVLDAPRG